MKLPTETQIPLTSLSHAQQEIVRRNLPLVHWTIRNFDGLHRRGKIGRSHEELFQEGSVALAEALRTHDPRLHGSFGAYAVSRIRFAMRRYAQESDSLVRVPFITQRRAAGQSLHRRRRPVADEDRHRPDAPPSVESLNEPITRLRRSMGRRSPWRSNDEPSGTPRVSIGELARDRLDSAMRDALREMKASPFGRADYQSLLEACMSERWEIPEESARTSIRQVAGRTGSSIGRVTRCEDRFRELVAGRLEKDAVFTRLRSLSREHRLGWDHPADEEELARFGCGQAVA